MSNEIATTEPQQGGMLAVIARAAADPNTDLAKMSALLDMQERIMAKNAEIAFNNALARLAKALSDVRIVRKGSVKYKNKKTEILEEAFKFAPYEEIDRAIRPIYTAEGFSLSFNAEQREGGGAVITATLSHIEGHSRSSSIPLPLDNDGGKTNIQGMGSTISYGKRYTTGMLLNIVTVGEDDDGAGNNAVTLDQAVAIDELLKETGTDKARFLKWAGAEDVPSIKAAKYEEAVKFLNAKKVKK
jgi:hypothetical protein